MSQKKYEENKFNLFGKKQHHLIHLFIFIFLRSFLRSGEKIRSFSLQDDNVRPDLPHDSNILSIGKTIVGNTKSVGNK